MLQRTQQRDYCTQDATNKNGGTSKIQQQNDIWNRVCS